METRRLNHLLRGTLRRPRHLLTRRHTVLAGLWAAWPWPTAPRLVLIPGHRDTPRSPPLQASHSINRGGVGHSGPRLSHGGQRTEADHCEWALPAQNLHDDRQDPCSRRPQTGPRLPSLAWHPRTENRIWADLVGHLLQPVEVRPREVRGWSFPVSHRPCLPAPPSSSWCCAGKASPGKNQGAWSHGGGSHSPIRNERPQPCSLCFKGVRSS